jgi:hypothetical protein
MAEVSAVSPLIMTTNDGQFSIFCANNQIHPWGYFQCFKIIACKSLKLKIFLNIRFFGNHTE